MPRSRYEITHAQAPHFLTATVNNWLPLFTRPETVRVLLDSWRFLQQESGFTLYGYVILENHLHMVAASSDLGRDIQRFKSWTAREILLLLQQKDAQRMLEIPRLCAQAGAWAPAAKNQKWQNRNARDRENA
jgi:REP element-mobilizing transposase RayT